MSDGDEQGARIVEEKWMGRRNSRMDVSVKRSGFRGGGFRFDKFFVVVKIFLYNVCNRPPALKACLSKGRRRRGGLQLYIRSNMYNEKVIFKLICPFLVAGKELYCWL